MSKRRRVLLSTVDALTSDDDMMREIDNLIDISYALGHRSLNNGIPGQERLKSHAFSLVLRLTSQTIFQSCSHIAF
jgi:hypothetical protein